MTQNLLKKPRIDENIKISECCICGETGNVGFTDTFQISLRDSFVVQSFVEIIFFTLGIIVQKESSEICALCKPKIIEFYHFKKRSQSVQKNFSKLIQEIMKIVGNYVSKNTIKSVTIEESKEKLVIMEKNSSENPTNLVIAEVSSICDVQLKQEPDSVDDININVPQIEIKKEPPDTEEFYDLPTNSIQSTNNVENEADPTEQQYNKLDKILSINQEILEIVKSLSHDKIGLIDNFNKI